MREYTFSESVTYVNEEKKIKNVHQGVVNSFYKQSVVTKPNAKEGR